MDTYTMTMRLGGNRAARLLLTKGNDELMRASLPQPAQPSTARPLRSLLEALAIWLDARLRVVLDAADPASGFCPDLTDELGIGHRTLFYEVVCLERRRHRGARVRGIGDFRDLRQLCLFDRLAGGRR